MTRPPFSTRRTGVPKSGQQAPAVVLAPDSLAYALQQAATLLVKVFEGGNLTDAYQLLLQTHPEWSDATRGAVRDLAWSTLRDYGRGDAVLQQLLHTPPHPHVEALLLLALHRLGQRPEQAHTVVDQTVQAVAERMPGLKGMANAVLRNALRQSARWPAWIAADEAALHACPRWWIARVRAAHPADWQAVLEAGRQHPPMALRVNPRRATIEETIATLQAADIAVRRLENDALVLAHPLPVARVPGHAEGRVSVQDAGAQWAARLLDARAGERVLDACSAPGGKTAHLLERSDIDLLALELDPGRIGSIHSHLQRLGLQAEVRLADCRKLDTWWDGRPFDRILADVPCSGSGVVRRHPDIKWLRRDEDIRNFARQQAEILDALWQTLAVGGTMLYVTCSVFDEENRSQIGRFLARHDNAERLPIDGRPDRTLLPCADNDGFYFALLRKSR